MASIVTEATADVAPELGGVIADGDDFLAVKTVAGRHQPVVELGGRGSAVLSLAFVHGRHKREGLEAFVGSNLGIIKGDRVDLILEGGGT